MEHNNLITRGENTIVFDFDGTLAFHPGGLGPPGEPIEGMPELLRELKEFGYTIVIQSCRGASYWKGLIKDHLASPHTQFKFIKKWCETYDVPCDVVWSEDKPLAFLYVDDRGCFFNGDAQDLREKLVKRKVMEVSE